MVCCGSTLASHSIPATEIPSSRMTVSVPTMRMSFSSSVIRVSTSCGHTNHSADQIRVRIGPRQTGRSVGTKSLSHAEHLHDRLREAHDVHGHGHGVGEGEDEANGASELRPQASGDQVVGSAFTAGISVVSGTADRACVSNGLNV